MRIIKGLNSTYKLKEMIKECYQEAQNHPFETYFFIVENPYVIEQLFFQYTHFLVNIEIMSWQQFLKQLIIENHLTNHYIISQTELVYHLRHILKEEDFACFNNKQPYPLIEKFIPLIKDYDLYQVSYDLQQMTSPKLKDFMHLYTSLINSLNDYTHLSLEDILQNCCFQSAKKHIYIEADHLYHKKRQNIIQQLHDFHDVTLFYTYHHDQRFENLPHHQFCQNAIEIDQPSTLTDSLFLQEKTVQPQEKAYTFVSATPYQETKKAVYTIAQMIIEEGWRYQDFVIVYPDSSYLSILKDTLDSAHLLHDILYVSSCQYEVSYQKVLSDLDKINEHDFHHIALALQQEELEHNYLDYFKSLENKLDHISTQEFRQFFQATYTFDHQERLQNQDHITVCTIDQLVLAKPKHIFFLGMNETIFPRTIKDTSLLLDEDIDFLRQNQIPTPLNTTEQLGLHHLDILKALVQPSLSMTFSYSQQTLSGEARLESSLYKQLQQFFEFIPLKDPDYLSNDDYYLQGGFLTEKSILNSHIHDYLETKNQPFPLSKELVEHLYSPTLSVSQIETYNKCPFLYFIQYGLGVYPLLENKLMPNELGSLVHYVLSINIDQEQNIDDLVNQYIQNHDDLQEKIKSSYIHQYFIKQLKQDLQTTLNVLKRQLSISEFHVFAKERKISNHILGIPFKGFVDRIDEYDNRIAIIDYKSSNKDIDLNLAMQGFNIQMLLYLKMVTEKYHKDPAAVLYFNTKKRILSTENALSEAVNEEDFYKQYRFGGYVIDDETHQNIHALDPTFDKRSDIINVTYVKSRDEYKGQLLTLSQLTKLFKEIEKHIHDLHTQITAGHIAIMPKGSDHKSTHTLVNPCHYCPYHSVCNFDVFYNDYQLVEFLDVEKILGGENNAV